MVNENCRNLAFYAHFVVQVVTNYKNTVQGFKRFHGRACADPYVQSVKSNLVYDLAPMPTGATGIKVRNLSHKRLRRRVDINHS